MTREQATSHYHIGNIRFYDGVHGAGLTPVKSGHYAYYKITDLDKLFKNKEPNIPKEIRRDYVRSCDVTKKYHIAMILSTVRMMDEGDFGTEHECSDEDFQAAMNISKALLQHTARVFRELPRVATQKAVGSGQKTVRRQLFLDALPDEFDRQNFIEISSRLGMPLSTAERNIKKWTDEGLLIRQDLGHYKKRN